MLTPFASASLDTLTSRAHTCIQMQFFKIIVSQSSKHIHLFFLKHARPKRRRVGSLAWDTLNSNHPLLRRQYVKYVAISMRPTKIKPSRDHQGQVSVIATHRSSMAGNAPQGPQSATCGGVGPTRPYIPRANPWCAHKSAEPGASLVWLLALATSAT